MDPGKPETSYCETILPKPTDQSEFPCDRPVRYDRHGLPLVPQPSPYDDDPLNWHPALKLWVALQVSWLALLGPLGAAAPNPAFIIMSEHFQRSVLEVSYELTLFLLFAGVGPLAVIPLASGYGRRPVYLVGNLIAAITNISAGYCNTWVGIMVTRALNGLAAGSVMAVGAATICDLYFMHQRGVYMGIYTVCLTNGSNIAPIVGGFAAESLGWRACFYIPGYLQLGTFIVTLFCLPETLFAPKSTAGYHQEQSYVENLTFRHSNVPAHRPHLQDYIRPFVMLKCMAVLFPIALYMACFGYGTILFALTGAEFFTKFYGFTTPQTGLMLSIPLLIGGVLGEFGAGWVTDWLSNRYAQRHSGERLPEARLGAIWGAILVPVGIITEGVCLTRYETVSWVGSAFGMGLSNMGLQIATTTIYAYTTDCYKAQSAEVSTILNVFRQVFSCLVSFYALPLAETVGIQNAWIIFAFIVVALLIPVVVLMFFGAHLRSLPWQSPPSSRIGSYPEDSN